MVKEVRKLTPAEVIASEDALLDFQFAVIDALNEKGITRVQFAEMLGVSRARVSQMLSSEANPTLKLVARALHLLGMKTNYCPVEGERKDIAAEEVTLEALAEVYEGGSNWEFAEGEFEAIAPVAANADDNENFRWWAHQHHQNKDVWRNNPRPVANYNGYKKLAAA